ncbi:MAG: YraN family protein [Firmicutes bacterium]|nr:YraN family protein [Bacillota bacterium]
MGLGKTGEDMAALHLRRKGYHIIEQNFRTKLGEIDIVARHKKTLVFCEVKTRMGRLYGHPIEAVTVPKQRRIKKIADIYLARLKDLHKFDSIRFDVICVLAEGSTPKIEHIENAF